MNRINIDFNLPIEITEEGKWFVSYCPILDVCSQGETYEEAKKNIVEALNLFLTTCYEMGTLEEVLKECGFQPLDLEYPQEDISSSSDDFVKISIPFGVSEQNIVKHKTKCRA